MKNKYKIILIICVIIGICSILVGSIAYYRIVVEGNIKGSTGNAVFVLKDENSNVWNNKEINLGKVNPGDSGEFTVTMDASGSTVDMYATLELDRGTLPTNLKFYTTSDHKSELHKYYSFLEKSGTSSETLTIYWYWNPYISDEEDNKFINVSNLEANIRVSAVQISEYAMMKNGAVAKSEFWSDTYRPYIKTITFGNDLSNLPNECTEENLCFDVTGDGSKKKVYGYLIDRGLTVSETDSSTSTTVKKTLYNLYIVSEAPIFAPTDCSFIFNNFKNLVQINFNNNFNTSKVTTMYYMFSSCSSLTDLDLSGFNTSNVTNMEYMFQSCSSLTSLDLSSFNTSKVTNMSRMFYNCSSLTSLDLSSFNTSKATNMSYMFSGCKSLTSIDLSSFNTSNVTDMTRMFSGCSSLTNLDLSCFNASKVTNMSSMFQSCSSLTSIDLSNFNTLNVTDMSFMFYSCPSLTSLDLSSFNTSNVTTMRAMFSYCSSLTSLDLSNFNTSKVTNMSSMFNNCSSLTNLNINNFDTSNITKMDAIFQDCPNITTTLNIMNPNMTSYSFIINRTATADGALVTLNYTADTSSLVDSIISSASSTERVVKGKQI